MSGRTQPPKYFQSARFVFENLCSHLGTESRETQTFLDHHEFIRSANRFSYRPEIQGIELHRTNHFADDFVVVKENVHCSFHIRQHSAITQQGHVRFLERSNPSGRKLFLTVLKNPTMWHVIAHSS